MNHTLASALDILVSGLWLWVALNLIAFPGFWIWRLIKRRPNNRSLANTLWFAGLFATPILLIFLFSSLIAEQARSEFTKFVRDHNSIVVSIGGRPVAQSTQALAALESMRQVVGHHSHPTNEILVELWSGRDKLPLVLGRDSDFPREYWVFFPRYRSSHSNEIGRITTPAFDGYP
jgi:hypothetical protein